MSNQITVTFDLAQLGSYTDEFLSTLWRVAQANPAPHGDREAGNIASYVGTEIIRRWLANAPVEMYRHQQRDNYWKAFTGLAKYEPGVPDFAAGRWVTKRPIICDGAPLLDDNGVTIDVADYADTDGLMTPARARSFAEAVTASLDRRKAERGGDE